MFKALFSYDCGTTKNLSDFDNDNMLIQFLIELNKNYDHVKNQILLMDPLSSLNKAYSMLLRIEKQREINNP